MTLIEPNLEPSYELSYLLGVRYGDSSVNHKDFQLGVKDKDFAEEFTRCLNKVSGRTYQVHQPPSCKGGYFVSCGLTVLCSYLLLELEYQKPIIEYYPEAFIRGFADSEGSVEVHGLVPVRITLCNNNTELLEYIKELLCNYFNIYSSITESGKNTPIGAIIGCIKGRLVIKRERQYRLRISSRNNMKVFAESIGFSIKRKQERLYQNYFTGGELNECKPS